jgi:preprotein translocase subunit SecG
MKIALNNISSSEELPVPPSLLRSLKAGFDAISNHVGLILFPVLLDLFLWFGPRLHLETLIRSTFVQAFSMPELQTADMADVLQAGRDLWLQVAGRFNLFSALRSYPIGVFSLMAGISPVDSPLGKPMVWDLASIGGVLMVAILLSLAGLAAGAFYFSGVSQAALTGSIDWSGTLRRWPWTFGQVFLLAILWLALAIAISIPFSCMFSLMMLGGVGLGRLSLLLLGGLLVWLLLPLVFSGHGIFIAGQSMWPSLRSGARLTRLTLPSTGLFLLVALLISQGLDTLWRAPGETSWLMAIGVAGHAFVTTGLLAASFVYYQDASRWVQQMFERMQTARQERV